MPTLIIPYNPSSDGTSAGVTQSGIILGHIWPTGLEADAQADIEMVPCEPVTHRQKLLYKDTCNLWQRQSPRYTDERELDDERFALLISTQKFYLFTKSEVSAPQVPGRMGADNIFTLDEAHFPECVPLNSGDVFKVTTGGHPLDGTYWRVLGDPQVKTERARRKPALKAVFVKRLKAAPHGVS